MQLRRFNRFLTSGDKSIEEGFVAVGIHSSSDCDLARVGDHVLGVGGLAPLDRRATPIVQVRNEPPEINGDDYHDAGGHLTLMLYEACDVLFPPSGRAPRIMDGYIANVAVPANFAAALPILRFPFQGRRQAVISFKRDTAAADLTLRVLGIRYGLKDARNGFYPSAVSGPMYTLGDEETWWDGAGAAPTVGSAAPLTGEQAWRTIHVGGFGDEIEAFDELAIFAYGAAGGSAYVHAEAFGERSL